MSAQHHSEVDKKQTNSPSQYKAQLGKLNSTGIEFPVSLQDIGKFEKNNPEIGVNVFGYDKSVHILRINKLAHKMQLICCLSRKKKNNIIVG